ncbi:hypothetical protein [Aeromonas sp. HMWF016]|uniref:hypothetical protein n=1 Tax=Aeromonas sp. HMWF016 TaxID=2056852 RepID=UPI0011B27351|nr:hypothetical protein [Aeromonas sp. HMWF016]
MPEQFITFELAKYRQKKEAFWRQEKRGTSGRVKRGEKSCSRHAERREIKSGKNKRPSLLMAFCHEFDGARGRTRTDTVIHRRILNPETAVS